MEDGATQNAGRKPRPQLGPRGGGVFKVQLLAWKFHSSPVGAGVCTVRPTPQVCEAPLLASLHF